MNNSPPRAGRREWIGLAVLALPCILATMDQTVLNLAAPKLSTSLKPSASQLLWIMDIYGFMIAGSLITMGTLGDRIGRRRLLLIGAAAFGAASMLAAFAPSAPLLIAARALLGVAGATLAPSTLSLIRNMFHDEHERTVAIGIWATCFSVGAMLGPVLGGMLLEHFWWGSVFLLNVPVMILLLALGPILLPEFRDETAGALDLLSAAMSLSSVLLIIYGLKKVAEHGWAQLPLFCIAAGAGIGAAFVARQRRLTYPFIDLKLFRRPAFTTALSLNLLGCFVAFGIFLFIAQYLQLVLELSPLKAGLWSLPSSAAFLVGAMLSPQIVRRVRAPIVVAAGLILTAAGITLLHFIGNKFGLFVLVAGTVIYSVGLAPVFTLGTELIVGSAPPERAGAAASMSEMSSEFGGALGIAVLGSIGTAVYRSQIILPDAMAPEAARAARSTLGGAVAIAQTLTEPLNTDVLNSSRAAFFDAFQLTVVICAITAMVMALLAWLYLDKNAAAVEHR